LETASFGCTPVAIDLICSKLCDHLRFDEDAPSFLVENPSVGYPTPLKVFLTRLFLSGISLLQH